MAEQTCPLTKPIWLNFDNGRQASEREVEIFRDRLKSSLFVCIRFVIQTLIISIYYSFYIETVGNLKIKQHIFL